MKKILSFIMAGVAVLSLASCNEKTGDDPKTPGITETNPGNNGSNSQTENVENYLTGTDAAKILLAQNRLNPQKLSDSVNIFDGEQVFTNLANKIRMNKKYQENKANTDVTITDDSVEWKNSDKNYSNSMSYFENISGNVESSAERGAELIRTVKSTIRVVNCWVNMGYYNVLLLVDENSETIIQKCSDYVDVCRRYTNEQNQDVYELYYNGEVAQNRMKYIENTLVEYFHDDHTTDFEHHFMADNTKGYWDVYGDLYNSEYTATVIKNELVYDYIGIYGEDSPAILDIVSNDRLNDVISLDGHNFELSAHAFDGIDKFVVDIESKDDIVDYVAGGMTGKVYNHGGLYYPVGSENVKLVLDNGKVFKIGDKEGKVTYNRAFLSADHAIELYYQTISLRVEGETLEEKFINLKEFLTSNGIICKYDLDEILDNVILAYEEIASEAKYRLWNGVVVNSLENANKALEIEKSKFEPYKDLLTSIENLEVIDIDDQDAINSKIDFADVKSYSQENVKFENNKVSIKNLKLTIDKSYLLDKKETYSLKFGLIDAENIFNEVILDVKLDEIPYNGLDNFELTYNGEFDLVNGGIGKYVLAVYLATSEGIRISELEYVKVDEYTEYQTKDVDHVVTVSKTIENYLYMEVEKNPDIYISDKLYYIPTYDELMVYMGSQANQFGLVPETSKIEILSETEEYVELATDIVSGDYRLYYQYYTKEGYKDAYVYVTLVLDVVEFEHKCDSITLSELKELFASKTELGTEFIVEVYSLTENAYIEVEIDSVIESGRYRVSYTKNVDEVEYTACVYLDLILEVDNEETLENEPENAQAILENNV